MMAVYFMLDKTAGSVKIGTSVDPKKRQKALQTGSTEPLILLGTIEGGRHVERDLHKRFHEYRIRGEWFKWIEISQSVYELLGKSMVVQTNRVYHKGEFEMITGVGEDELQIANSSAMYRWQLPLLTPCGRVRGDTWIECQRREFLES
jgi:hypothetical protein